MLGWRSAKHKTCYELWCRTKGKGTFESGKRGEILNRTKENWALACVLDEWGKIKS